MGSGIFYPVASGDDGYWQSGYFAASGFLYIGDYLLKNNNSFVRFTSVTIPKGATITNAYVKFTCGSTGSSTTVRLNTYFNNVDDAVAPTNESEADALSLTSAVSWDSLPGWSNGSQYDTVDLTTILQTIINRSGWVSGYAVQIVIKDNSSDNYASRIASGVDQYSATEKAELHVTWQPPIIFTFSNPLPANLSTVYGTTELLSLTTTISGSAESYTYDAVFYDDSDVQIGTTILGINSGSPATSNTYLSTSSGIDYSWYVVSTSSGIEDTSSTYTFSNRFLYYGYVTENSDPINRIVRLYNRDTGELVDSTTSSGSNGYYSLDATINSEHFIVAFDDEAGEDYNSLILDRLLPNGE